MSFQAGACRSATCSIRSSGPSAPTGPTRAGYHVDDDRRVRLMKVTQVTAREVRTPADDTLLFNRPAPPEPLDFVTLELGTDEGLVGVGVTFFGAALNRALKVAVEDLGNLIVG